MSTLYPTSAVSNTDAPSRRAPATQATGAYRYRVSAIVVMLSLAAFVSSLDMLIVNLAFPYIGREYPGTSLGSLSWVLNAYTIVFAAVLVPAGRWADRIGRRQVFMIGMAGFTFGSLACGLAPGVPELIGARVIQAAGAGLMVPASLSLLLASVPVLARAKAIGAWAAAGALGATLGPAAGGNLVQMNWRWVFLVNLPVGIVALALTRRVLPEGRDEHVTGRPDLAGAGLLAAAVGLLALGLVEAPAQGWASAAFIGTIAAAALCGAAMVLRCRVHHSPVIELSLLRVPTFSGSFAALILYYIAFGAFVLNSAEYLAGIWHYSAASAGLAIAPGPLIMLLFAGLVAPRLAAWLGGPGRVAVIGCFVSAASMMLWYSQLQVAPAYLTHMLPSQLLAGAGVGLSNPSLVGAGTAQLPPERFGTGSGVLNMARQIGTVIGVASLMAVLARFGTGDPIAAFRHALMPAIFIFAAAGLISAALLTGRSAPAVPERLDEVGHVVDDQQMPFARDHPGVAMG